MPAADILMTELAEAGFESFEDTPGGFRAYISAEHFEPSSLSLLERWNDSETKLSFVQRRIPAQNWNEAWESNFQPVSVAGRCLIRAPFHEPQPEFEYELVIEPRMSFGTGHHETTSLVTEKLLTMNLSGRWVMDMGCGTGVLGILAAKRGAAAVMGIDIEENAVENARENVARNGVSMAVEKGDEAALAGRKFHVILANINKNVLLGSIPLYAEALEPGGNLILSGFFTTDEAVLNEACRKAGLEPVARAERNSWSLLEFTRKEKEGK